MIFLSLLSLLNEILKKVFPAVIMQRECRTAGVGNCTPSLLMYITETNNSRRLRIFLR